jgi:predicted transcriptional regulator
MISPKSMPGYWSLRKDVLEALSEGPMTLKELAVKLDGWDKEEIKQMVAVLRSGVVRIVDKQGKTNVYGVNLIQEATA